MPLIVSGVASSNPARDHSVPPAKTGGLEYDGNGNQIVRKNAQGVIDQRLRYRPSQPTGVDAQPHRVQCIELAKPGSAMSLRASLMQLRFWVLVTGAVLATASCASTRQQGDQIDRALFFCRQILGPDANKVEGEAWFWFQSERVGASRMLWNSRGIRSLDARLATATSEIDRNCLKQLRQEAIARQVDRDQT